MGIAADEHPEQERLIAYGQGRLGQAESVVIESHLDDCPQCCDTLLHLEDDTLMQLLRGGEAAASTSDTESSRSPASDTALPVTYIPAGQTPVDLPTALVEHSRYQILERIGHGGMGEVFRAKHTEMDRIVALKIVNPQLVQNHNARQRFEQEVRAAAKLSHPNIVTAFDAEVAGEHQFLVMEYVEGQNLAHVVHESGPLSVEDACTYTRQVASGLQHAFEMQMVHRDIKPHNLMLVSPSRSAGGGSSPSIGQVRILDFGLSRFLSESEDDPAADDPAASEEQGKIPAVERLTKHTTLMGTPDYVSPEQARDARSADIRSDIYSLGCTMFFLLTGQPPFVEPSPRHVEKSQGTRERAQLSDFRDDLPDGLEEIVEQMIATDPDKRFSEPAEVESALAAFTPRAGVHPTTQRGWKRRLLSPRAIVAGFIGVLIAGVLVFKTGNGEIEIDVPEDATVKIDGDEVTVEAGMNRLKIQLGKHRIEVIEDGWISEQEITIRWRFQRVRAADSDRPRVTNDEQWITTGRTTNGFSPTADGSTIVAGNWTPDGAALLQVGYDNVEPRDISFAANFSTRPDVLDSYRNHHGGVAVTADERYAFVTNYYDDDVYRIDLRTGEVQSEFIEFRWGQTLRLSSDERRLVACFGQDNRSVDEQNDGLAILDVTRDELKCLKIVSLPDEPIVTGLALSSDSEWAFVACRRRQSDHPTVYRVGLNSPFTVSSIGIAGSQLGGIAVSTELGRVFVSDSAKKVIRVLRDTDLLHITDLPFAGQAAGALAMTHDERLLIAISPEARRLYCLEPNRGIVLGEATGLDTNPRDVQVSRDNRFAFVSHSTAESRIVRFRLSGLVDRIVFASNRGDASYQLYTAKTNGRDVRPLRPNLSTSRSPRWAPDGTTIAYVSTETGKPRICTIRRDGADETFRAYEKTNPPGFAAFIEAMLDWSPDGREIVFIADDRTTLRIIKTSDDNEGRVLISGPVGPGAGQYEGVSWSRDGSILLSAAHHANGTSHELFRIDPKTGDVIQLTDFWNRPEYFISPVDSPNGGRLVAVKIQEAERFNLFLLDSDGNKITPLTNGGPGTFYGDPRWFPSGTRLIFTLGRQGHSQLYSSAVDGTDQVRLTKGDWDDVEPDVWTLR